MFGHSIHHCSPASPSQTSAPVNTSLHSEPVNKSPFSGSVNTSLHSEPVNTSPFSETVNTSLHSEPITSTPEPMGKPLISFSAARPGEASASRASSSSSQAEHLSCDHFQEQKQKLSKDIRLTKTQSQPGHTPVACSSNRANLASRTSSVAGSSNRANLASRMSPVAGSSNRANLASRMSPVACASTSATKTTRSPVLAKLVYTGNTGCDAVDARQRRRGERLGNIILNAARCRVFEGRKGNNQISSSKSQTTNSVNFNNNASSPAAQVSTSADKAPRATVRESSYKLTASDVAEFEARYMAIALGKELLQNKENWNLNWSCSLMTHHDTHVIAPEWLHLYITGENIIQERGNN